MTPPLPLRRLAEAGHSVQEIARRLGLTDYGARQILAPAAPRRRPP